MTKHRDSNPVACVDALRADRARLNAERRDLERAPLPREEAEAELEARIATAGARVELDAAPLAWPSSDPARHDRNLIRPATPMTTLGPDGLTFAALCKLTPDAVRAAAAAALDALYAAHAPGLPAADRAAALAALDRQLGETELSEERCIRAAEDAGLSVARRADADPELVLAADLDADPLVPDLERLHDLRQRAEALHAALLGAVDRRNDARELHQRAAAALDEARREAGRFIRGVEGPDLTAHEQHAARLERDYQRAADHAEALAQEWRGAHGLAERCRDWCRFRGLSVEAPAAPPAVGRMEQRTRIVADEREQIRRELAG
jgi:hypothetical protein